VLFLITLQVEPEIPQWAANKEVLEKQRKEKGFKKQYGIKYIRGCEVEDVLGFDGKPLNASSFGDSAEGVASRRTGGVRHFRVLLDPNQYQSDMRKVNAKEGEDVYATFNILLRRKPQENNFKAVLDCIKGLMQSDDSEIVVPDWLHDVLLGYGEPEGAHYSRLGGLLEEKGREVDFRDTFLGWDHLVASFKEKVIYQHRNLYFVKKCFLMLTM
jgi:intron-binding protein aquarius